jgi:hypothetical protein
MRHRKKLFKKRAFSTTALTSSEVIARGCHAGQNLSRLKLVSNLRPTHDRRQTPNKDGLRNMTSTTISRNIQALKQI